MKLALTNIQSEETSGRPPLGVAYLASYVRKYSENTEVVIIDKEKDTLKKIISVHPDAVGISSVTTLFSDAKKLADRIKSCLDIPVFIGGSHISALPKTLPKNFDLGVVNEGEEVLRKLCDSEFNNYESINGICYHKKGKIKLNRQEELITPLDKIPYPARDLLNMEKNYLMPRRAGTSKSLARATHMFTSRGCPYDCPFCPSPSLWGRKLRMFSADYVVGEVKELIDNYGVEEILIFDDLFGVNKKRLKEIVSLINKEKINSVVDFACLLRTDFVDSERLKLFKEMNVTQLSLGLESGSQKILDMMKNNTITLEQNVKALALSKKYGVGTHGFFMLGSPGETKEDMIATLKFIKNNPIDTITLSLVTPFPGTKLWKYAKQEGIVTEDMDWSKLDLIPNSKNILNLNVNMDKKEFMYYFDDFKKQISEKQYALDFRFIDLLSPFVLKWGLNHPKEAWKYFHHSIKKKLV